MLTKRRVQIKTTCDTWMNKAWVKHHRFFFFFLKICPHHLQLLQEPFNMLSYTQPKKIQNAHEVKRTLFNRAKQDKTNFSYLSHLFTRLKSILLISCVFWIFFSLRTLAVNCFRFFFSHPKTERKRQNITEGFLTNIIRCANDVPYIFPCVGETGKA